VLESPAKLSCGPLLFKVVKTMKKIAIVGRPNVGKSTLFNRLLGRKVAIVQDQPGVTRDRNIQVCKYDEKGFLLLDTGGGDS